MTAKAGGAVVFWTGGKDSNLALYEARASGLDVRALVTLAPRAPRFLAHPLFVMQAQAAALALEHAVVEVDEPFTEGYHAALASVVNRFAVRRFVTGDIDLVDGHESWMERHAAALGCELIRPLWQRPRELVLERILEIGLRVIVTCVKTPPLDESWVGRELDRSARAELLELAVTRGVDPCGERGEYHTMALDGPGYGQRLVLDGFDVGRRGDLAYLVPHGVRLEEMPPLVHPLP
jgi:diphthine-ammonia ligase